MNDLAGQEQCESYFDLAKLKSRLGFELKQLANLCWSAQRGTALASFTELPVHSVFVCTLASASMKPQRQALSSFIPPCMPFFLQLL